MKRIYIVYLLAGVVFTRVCIWAIFQSPDQDVTGWHIGYCVFAGYFALEQYVSAQRAALYSKRKEEKK